MKQLIVPVAIIVALIAFFVIVDRKEFSRHDDVQTVQSESPTGKHPEVKFSAEINRSFIEDKPSIETKTIAEPQPAVAEKPVTVVPPSIEIGPASVIKTEDNPTPTAIPVVTQEEAEKANQEAIALITAEKEKTEPFFILYEGLRFDTISFEGTVRTVSPIPNPEENDYPNCLYSLLVDVNSFSTTASDKEIAPEIIINAPIIKDKKVVEAFRFLPGDKISCLCVEYEAMPHSIQEIQLSDSIQSFEHTMYYPISANHIDYLQPKRIDGFAKQKIAIHTVQPTPKDENAARRRKERIQEEIARIEEELKQHGGSFEMWEKEYAPIAEKYKEMSGEEMSVWIKDSFFSAGGKEGEEIRYNTKQYIDGLKPYKEYLESKNIDLIVVRIPGKGDFAARVLASDDYQENPAWVKHYYECLKNDIEIVDPMPEMWKHRFDFPLFYYYKSEEIHPFEGTYYYCASVLSEVLKRYHISKDQHSYSLKRVFHPLNTYTARKFPSLFLYPSGNPTFDPQKPLEYNQVQRDGSVLEDFAVNSGSPILFLSNSFFGCRDYTKDLGLPQYASFFLELVPDWLYQPGGYSSLVRSLLTSNDDLLSGRKVVILVGMQRMWASFPSFPRYISDNAESLSLEYKLSIADENVNIINKSSFNIHKKKESNIVSFKLTDADKTAIPLIFSMEIPAIEDKRVCMVRIKIINNGAIVLSVNDANDKTPIDSCLFPGYEAKSCDIFVPVESQSRQVEITLNGIKNNDKLDDIELWYY